MAVQGYSKGCGVTVVWVLVGLTVWAAVCGWAQERQERRKG